MLDKDDNKYWNAEPRVNIDLNAHLNIDLKADVNSSVGWYID